MRIAHINEIAGVAWRLAKAQRQLGHDACVFTLQKTPYEFPSDMHFPGAEGPLGWNAVMFSNWREFTEFDVIHVHGGIWRTQMFYPLFKRRFHWKTLAVHFHGSETRTGKGLHHLDTVDLQFRSTQDLSSLLPDSTWIPNPIDLPDKPIRPENRIPKFGHFPTNPVQKGTEKIVEIFKNTFGPAERAFEGHIEKYFCKDAELVIASQMPHKFVMGIMAGCDAVIDQLSPYESYGMVGIEGMALEKPVFGSVNPDWYPGCPILALSSDKTEEVMRDVASDGNYRMKLGRAGRSYVEKIHASGNVARQVLKCYYIERQDPPLSAEDAATFWRRRGGSYRNQVASSVISKQYVKQSSELVKALGNLDFTSMLEIGCGYGRIGHDVVGGLGSSWTGIDLSRDQLLDARRLEASLRGSLIEASATSIPCIDSCFDLALAVEVLLHIPPEKISQVMQELWRISRQYIVHLDWFEDYLVGYKTGWCWVHDYPNLWRPFGAQVEEIPLTSSKLQRLFIVKKLESKNEE